MTIVVGILCEDGVVVGSDSSATFTAGEFRTIEQPTEKTFVIGNDLVLSFTGQAGLAQRFHKLLSEVTLGSDFKKADCQGAANLIAHHAIQNFQFTGAPKGEFGALVAFACQKRFHLCEFAIRDFQPEHKTEKNWFVTMGCGQPITDPFLGMLSRAFFDSKPPKLQEGVFAAVWALDHAIELNPGGIKEPLQVATLACQNSDKFLSARLLAEEELQEHLASVRAAETHLASFRNILSGATIPEGTSKPPDPPEG